MAVIIESPLAPFGVLSVCSYALNQHNCNLVAHFGFYPVCIAFYVENNSVVAQKAGTRVTCLNVSGAGPIGLLNLEDPHTESGPNGCVLFCKLGQQFFAD